MNKVFFNKEDNSVPIKIWATELEDGALSQAKDVASLPFVNRHVAIMPDSHQGYGVPIGCVFGTNLVIIPNAVGVDIGCGMVAQKTNISIESLNKDMLANIHALISDRIPVGFNWHNEDQDEKFIPSNKDPKSHPIVYGNLYNARKQVGTLGGGNHFIELQAGSDGFLWIMIHSGSRNLGYSVAKHYHGMAVDLNKKWHSIVPEDLAFLPMNTEYGKRYYNEMQYCVEFAFMNRWHMMGVCLTSIKEVIGEFNYGEMINKSHNYAEYENHFCKNMMIHRKGACRARAGELVMIPGSQGTKSYIASGLGNIDSFYSCSHGAGRIMGRKQAQRELDFDNQRAILDDLGVIHSMNSAKDLDEAPGSYKDIDVVMENQKDLVKIEVELTPLAVVKG